MEEKRRKKKEEMETRLIDLRSLKSLIDETKGTADQQHPQDVEKEAHGQGTQGVDQIKEELKKRGIACVKELVEQIDHLEVKLNLKQKKVLTDAEKYDLIDRPDEELTEEQLKRKRVQKMQKSSSIAREEKRKKAEEEQRQIDALKDDDKDKYIKSLYDQRKYLLDSIELRKKKR